MYKVFVVDDEVVVRESIRSQVDWDNSRFTLSGEASDGEMALSMIKDIKPDVLLTDIRMPFLDGLQLVRIVKQTMPWIRIIILSGHDEFEYAQRAISIGVQAYLLKPISVGELMDAFENAAQSIEDEAAERANTLSLKAMLESTSEQNVEQLFTDILVGAIESGKAIERALSLGIELICARYMVVITELSSPEKNREHLLLARKLLRELTSGDSEIWQSFGGVERLVTLVKGESDEAAEERAYAFAQAVQHEIGRNTGCTVSIGMGSIVTHISLIPESYFQAGQVFKRLGSAMDGKIYGISDLSQLGEFVPKNLPEAAQLKYAPVSEIPLIICNMLEPLGGSPMLSALWADYILTDMLVNCVKLLRDSGCEVEEVLPETKQMSALTHKSWTRDALSETMADILRRTFAARDANAGTKYAATIRKAQAYIDQNYSDANISLQSVASHVSLSSNHFCTIFAQETKQTFIEYLTATRIKRAKELLGGSALRTSEISYSVGYNDPHYFSYIFKKHAGLAPRDYRKAYSNNDAD